MKRLDDRQLLALLNDLESDRTERKESFKGETPKKAREAVCAFANDLPNHNEPGVLFIGVKDNGEPSGLEITDRLLLSLADMKTDGNILPPPVLTVEKRSLKGYEVAVVTVMPSDVPPLRYSGRIWVRTGPRRSIAGEQEERILNEKRRWRNLPWDLHPMPMANLEVLSRTIFENEYLPAAFSADVLEANHRTYEERLSSCKMIVLPDTPIPTVTGLLALGKAPQDYLPGACIQFLRIDGTRLADEVVDEELIGGAMVEMLRRTEEKLQAHNRIAMDITSGPTHSRRVLWPPEAIHQLIYNAVLHRSYEGTNAPIRFYWFNDRIEITSPGGPYGNVTSDNFGTEGITDYRNPNLCDVLKTFGYVQGFGRGLSIARDALLKNGNPDVEFKVNSSVVQCTVRRC